MRILLLLPILIPLFTAILSLLAWNKPYLHRVFSAAGASGLLIASLSLFFFIWQSGIQAVQIGNWPAPFGITLVADLFSATMVVLAGLIGMAVAVYSLAGIDPARESFGYYPLLHILLMGICGAFLTGDIFNLYVWFEVMLIAAFVLLGLGGERAQLEGTIKYVTLNLMASAFFLVAVGVSYGVVGTLNMADLARHMSSVKQSGLVTAMAMLFLLAFGIKAAIFPLFFWLPSSYHTPPAPVSAVFAGLLTKVGVYALIRVFTLLFVHDIGYTHKLLLILAALTMVTGILGALVQVEFRRIISFNVVSHMGYMLMGLAIFTPLALAGSVFYIIHDVIVKASLFLVSGVVYRLRGTCELKKLGGLYVSHPGLSILFLIPALSLAGIPPLSGFWGKFILVKAGLDAGQYLVSATALFVGLLTLLSMVRIWSDAFWKKAPEELDHEAAQTESPLTYRSSLLLLGPIAGLAFFTVLMGILVEPFFAVATRAAEELVNPNAYIAAVLGDSP